MRCTWRTRLVWRQSQPAEGHAPQRLGLSGAAPVTRGCCGCRADQVRAVGPEKEMMGVMTLLEALDRADELDVDVVMINPKADPPVVRLVDFSKFRYEQARAVKEASKKQREAR